MAQAAQIVNLYSMPIDSVSTDYNAVLEAVTKCALFKQISSSQIDELLGYSRVLNLDEGDLLAQQGQPATEFFLNLNGEIKLAATSPMGQEKILHIIHPGQTFAEVLMFLEKPTYPANIAALVTSQVVAFPSKIYKAMLAGSVDACFGLLGGYAIRNRQLIGEIEALTLHNATFRVVHYLLKEVPSHQHHAASVELRAPKHVVASRVSITPETLSRILSKLKRDGIIEVSEKRIMLNDLDWMRKFISMT